VQIFLEQSEGQGQLLQFDTSLPDTVVILFT
jgi:hypothetical protein